MEQRFTDLDRMLDERYATQTKALDAAFIAQQTAMKTALEAAEKAVRTAQVATEKRFESVNEFRGQLTDQAATFLSRNEADTRLNALAEKLEAESKRNTSTFSALELRLTSRLDQMAGEHTGSNSSRTERRLDAGSIYQMLTTLAALVTVLVILLHL
jgi:hypothetical protein